jgi:hypothetical protein
MIVLVGACSPLLFIQQKATEFWLASSSYRIVWFDLKISRCASLIGAQIELVTSSPLLSCVTLHEKFDFE